MPIHKLADGPITMTITGVREVPSSNPKWGAQYAFDAGDDTVFVGKGSALRQLERLQLSVDDVIGETLRFEQVEKGDTKYTNIYRANPADAGTASAPAGAASSPRAAAAPAAPKLTVSEASALYREALMGVYQTLGDACAELGVPVTADALQAAAATVFIAAKGR